MDLVRQIKSLKTRLRETTTDINMMSSELLQKIKELDAKKAVKLSLLTQIRNLEAGNDPKVSEHATLRYFEHVLGFNLKEIQDKILPEDTKEQLATLGGSGLFPVEDFKVRVKNYTAVTVIKD